MLSSVSTRSHCQPESAERIMEDPDNSAQKPVATAGSRKSGVLKLPLANRCGPDEQHCPNDESNKNPAKSRSRRQSLWYALYFPQLSELSESQQTQILTELAGLAENVSATVSFHSQALVCEIRSSLRYFDGIDNIHSKLQSLIVPALQNRSLGGSFLYAASPTVSGSLLLARSGHNALVYQKENLRSALGKLSVDVLDLQKEQRQRLHSMGVRKIRDIWRLPTKGLHKRFGSNFVNSLGKAVGKSPEPTRNYIPSPEFSASYDLPYEVGNLHCLLPIIDEILIELRDFLIQRDLSTSRLRLSMIHEKRSRTEIDIGLRQATRQRDHLLLLIETHFAQLAVPAPVVGLELEVKQFDAFLSESDALLTEEQIGYGSKINSKNLDKFTEQLHARL
ncbi:MAG: DNA polymerase Y family protein, partial [Pseudomonadota bacterium]|nr:DNA polymerase Y family protein [Pseudomonadota bacterium]